MKVTDFNQLSIGTKDPGKLVKFYETKLGVQISYDFRFKTNYLRCGRTIPRGACCLLVSGSTASQVSASG
jgi:hypothetical protein